MGSYVSRYTDAQVLVDLERVQALAIAYVNTYTGDFPTLIAMRDRLIRGEKLTVTHVRTVLNCMRADPNISQLPKIDTNVDLNVETITVSKRERSTYTRVKQRPPFIVLPVAWRHTYVMSTHKTAQVIHILNVKTSTITYYPHASGAFHTKFKAHLHYLCSTFVGDYRNGYSNIAFLSIERAYELIDVGERRWCATCPRLVL